MTVTEKLEALCNILANSLENQVEHLHNSIGRYENAPTTFSEEIIPKLTVELNETQDLLNFIMLRCLQDPDLEGCCHQCHKVKPLFPNTVMCDCCKKCRKRVFAKDFAIPSDVSASDICIC